MMIVITIKYQMESNVLYLERIFAIAMPISVTLKVVGNHPMEG